MTPNGISFCSIVFGCSAGATFAATPYLSGWALCACWLAAAAGIQLRLIANLLDGMVAVEGRKGGPTGDLWNEAPDRISDAAIFIGAGYAAGSSPMLGWAAALMAVFVAYVRALGASVGAGQCFLGPQAKPQRMAVMTMLAVANGIPPIKVFGGTLRFGMISGNLLITASEPASDAAFPFTLNALVLLIIIVGCIITAARRLLFIAKFLREKAR